MHRQDNIRTCRQLKQRGHTIIIYTSRGQQQSNGNAGVALKNVAKVMPHTAFGRTPCYSRSWAYQPTTQLDLY